MNTLLHTSLETCFCLLSHSINSIMLSFNVGLYLLIASLVVFHMLPSPVACDDKEKDLLRDINTYRKVLNLPVLVENKKASCLAEEIADDLEDAHCEDFRDYYPMPGNNSKIPNFQKNIDKCSIHINTTTEGVIMPLCVPKLNPDDLFSNYTKSNRFTKYLNSSKYKSAGVGSEDDWMVFIVTTNTSSGDFSFSSASSLLPHFLMFAFFFTTLLLFFN